jgi:1,4-alpha-glucan branching enzyme
MKIKLLLSLLFFSTIAFAQVSISPSTFEVDEEITITVDLSQTQCNTIPTTVNKVYMHSGIGTETNAFGFSVIGNWGEDDGVGEMTSQGNGIFSITMTPSEYYEITEEQANNATRLGLVFRNASGTQEMKQPNAGACEDFIFNIGSFQLSLTSPTSSAVILDSGDQFNITASTSLNADFELFANGNIVSTQNNTQSFSYSLNASEDVAFELVANETNGTAVQSERFNLLLTPNPSQIPVPNGMENGINYDPSNPDEITLVLFAPNKEFVHVANNLPDSDYALSNIYLMNFDANQDKHWITIDLSERIDQDNFFYEYVIENEFRVPDPFSRLSLNQFNDPFIMSEGVFPGLPSFPTDKTSNILTWVRLNQPEYEWQITDFERPDQEDLVVYELLIRDFDENHSYQDVIDRLDYLEELGINAIELMPISEFDNNDSWGYNPSLHMSIDKYYGTPEKFKELVDQAHARGMAVILDVVYNHATAQSPYFRMDNDCNGCIGGSATAENPLFAEFDPNPTFSFFEKINHNKSFTHEWLDMMNKYWLEEYNIDGYRFDFTKGFTMTPGDGGGYDQPRIDNLTRMYNEIRQYDETAYVILEHFAPDSEEQVLVNHRFDGSNPTENGMLTWGNVTFQYAQASMGYDNSNFNRVTYKGRNNSDSWSPHSVLGYMESHDEERQMFRNSSFGNENESGDYQIKDLNTGLSRLELTGAFYFTVPGPKMIWQFGEIGFDFSINRCPDGSINDNCRTAQKPLVWDYLSNPNRMQVYDTWKKLIQFKKQEPIFKTTNFTLEVSDDVEKKIFLVNDDASGDEIRYVTVVGNFGVNPITTQPFFQEAGTWYNVLVDSPFEVTDTNMSITLEAGEFIVFANETTSETLSVEEVQKEVINVYPNPATTQFAINTGANSVEVYSINGKQVAKFNGNFSANHRFDVSTLTSGLYLLKVQNENSTSTTKLLIK